MALITASSINYDLHPLYRVVGYYIYDEQERDVADIRDLLLDSETKKPRYAIIEIGGLMSTRGKVVLIPWTALTKAGMSRLDINCSGEHIDYAPTAEDPLSPTDVEEEKIHFHFNTEPYWLAETEDKTEKKDIKVKPPSDDPIGNLELEKND